MEFAGFHKLIAKLEAELRETPDNCMTKETLKCVRKCLTEVRQAIANETITPDLLTKLTTIRDGQKSNKEKIPEVFDALKAADLHKDQTRAYIALAIALDDCPSYGTLSDYDDELDKKLNRKMSKPKKGRGYYCSAYKNPLEGQKVPVGCDCKGECKCNTRGRAINVGIFTMGIANYK
jgi:hypothetical protein